MSAYLRSSFPQPKSLIRQALQSSCQCVAAQIICERNNQGCHIKIVQRGARTYAGSDSSSFE